MPDEVKQTFQEWSDVGYTISAFLLLWVTAALGIDWIANFLHAPIGFKDSRLNTSIGVEIAQLAFWPVFILFCTLWLLRNLYGEKRPKDVAIGFVVFFAVAVSIVGFGALCIGRALHRELIPGSNLFWETVRPTLRSIFDTVAPFGIAGIFLFVDGLLACTLLQGWNGLSRTREKVAACVLGVSTLCGIIAFIGMCLPTDILGFWSSRLWFLAIVFFLIGVGYLTKQTAKEHKARLL